MKVKIEDIWVDVTGTVFPRRGDWSYATPNHIREYTKAIAACVLEMCETYGEKETKIRFGLSEE